jgi:tetratricopeptide (TPR) repeat protein
MPDLKYSNNMDETKVDLGEDLLEKTRILPSLDRPKGSPPPPPVQSKPKAEPSQTETIEDRLQTVKILMNEGFLEEAKKHLHQILIGDPGNSIAQRYLDEIQKTELKTILGENETKRPYGKKSNPKTLEINSNALILQLDRELKLDLFSENNELLIPHSSTYFQDPQVLHSFFIQLEKSLHQSSLQDWIDLGVAFLEMELYPISVRIFSHVNHRIELADLSNSELALSTVSLLSFSLLMEGKPFEAISRIQPILKDAEIPQIKKVELYYLMGRIHESMKKSKLAVSFYHQVLELDPSYRDTSQRLSKQNG